LCAPNFYFILNTEWQFWLKILSITSEKMLFCIPWKIYNWSKGFTLGDIKSGRLSKTYINYYLQSQQAKHVLGTKVKDANRLKISVIKLIIITTKKKRKFM